MTQRLSDISEAVRWLHEWGRGALCSDHRRLGRGDVLFAWPGARHDARQYVAPALEAGAAAALVEWDGCEAFRWDDDRVAGLQDLRRQSGPLADAYYEHPSAKLAVLAVTGTNGKTSTAWWLAHALSNLKHPAPIATGFAGTLGVGPVHQLQSSGLTTPDATLLHHMLRRFADTGLQACALEASSIGIEEGRLDGCRVRVAMFSNLTQDHLDYHQTMHAYGEAKAQLFAWPGLESAVLNIDDPFGAELAKRCVAQGVPDIWTVSCQQAARLHAQDVQQHAQGLRFLVCEGEQRLPVTTNLIGRYNVSNLLLVLAGMRALGVPLQYAVEACHALQPVPGRMEIVMGGDSDPMAVVDYAHTPDALRKALEALREVSRARGGALWCVFGCGGDRDRSKRPQMGALAAQLADHVVLTSDNPRSEDPCAILADIQQGVPNGVVTRQEVDRRLAITEALQTADARDVVLIAGKGHEDYQEALGQRMPFLDTAVARQVLEKRRGVGVVHA